jgi:hypothetical protein
MAHRLTLARWLLVLVTLMLLGAIACGTAANSPGNNSSNTANDPAATNPADASSTAPVLKVSGIPD